MKIKTAGMLLVILLTCVFVSAGTRLKFNSAAAGGTEVMIVPWTPGQGAIAPGAILRGWTTQYQDSLIGPAGDLASGSGPVTMNCNLDEDLTGPCWGTFEIANNKGSWVGAWEGTFNFVTRAGSYKAVGHGQRGLKGMILENNTVYPGWAVSATPYGGSGYIYSTVIDHGKF
jgi:hypothetical protein